MDLSALMNGFVGILGPVAGISWTTWALDGLV